MCRRMRIFNGTELYVIYEFLVYLMWTFALNGRHPYHIHPCKVDFTEVGFHITMSAYVLLLLLLQKKYSKAVFIYNSHL